MNNIFIPIISFFISIFFLSKSKNFLGKYFIDLPNARSSHIKKRPKGGGYIFVFNSIFSSILYFDYSLILSIPLALIGLLDDSINLSRKLRLFSQFVTVVLILYFIGIPSYFNLFPIYIIFSFLVLLGITLINFTNFVDGIDGIVAGCFFVIFLMASIFLNHIYIPIATSLLAFLFFNWEPSKIFMGDIGSTFLGAIFFTMLLQCKNIEQFFAFIFISSPLMFDAFTCIVRRYFRGKDIFSPHRDHLYQRLCDNNISHSNVSLMFIFSTIFISLAYVFFGINSCFMSSLLFILFGVIFDKKLAKKFN